MTVRFQMQAETSDGLIPLRKEPVAHTCMPALDGVLFSFGQYGSESFRRGRGRQKCTGLDQSAMH